MPTTNDGTGVNWVEGEPADSDLVLMGPTEIKDLRIGVKARFSKEHITPANASVGGGLREGAGRAYYRGTTPLLAPDGTRNLGEASDSGVGDFGRLWVDGNQKMWVWNDGTFAASGNVPGSGWVETLAEVVATRKVHSHQFGGGAAINYTFPFVPVIVIIIGDRLASGQPAQIGWIRQGETTFTKMNTGTVASISCSLAAKVFTMASTNNDFNGAGFTYTMIAFG